MGLFSGSSDCPATPSNSQVKANPLVGSITFQHLVTIIAWACFAVSAILWLWLIIPHLRRYEAPREQRQIFRITLTPLVFTIVAVITTHAYNVAGYLAPIANLFEVLALASLFLLYVQYVAPEATTRNAFFSGLEMKDKKGNVTPGRGLRFFWVRIPVLAFSLADSNK
jgi:heme A synthase